MKKVIVLLLAASMCLSFVSCGQPAVENDPPEEMEHEDNTPTDTEPTDDTTVDTEPEDDPPAETEPAVDLTTPFNIEIGEKAAAKDCEFYVEHIKIDKKIIPCKSENGTGYTADVGKVYVDICIALTNKGNKEIDGYYRTSATLRYAGNYDYKGTYAFEINGRTFYTNVNSQAIAPQETGYIHYLFEVPKEVQTSDGELKVLLNIMQRDGESIVRSGETTTYKDPSVQTTKESGEVVIGEVVGTENSVFYIDHSNIKKNAEAAYAKTSEGFYTYFKSDEGTVFADICFVYKNTGNEAVQGNKAIFAKINYAGSDDYEGFAVVEDDERRNLSSGGIIKLIPLSTEYVHCLFELPEEAETNNEPIELTFTIDGNTYTYKVR